MKRLIGLVVLAAFFIGQGCATNSSLNLDSPKACPGVPPGKEFGLSPADMLSNMNLIKANNAMVEQNWEKAEIQFMTVLLSPEKSKAMQKFAAHALVHAQCMQGKHEAARSIAREYQVPY